MHGLTPRRVDPRHLSRYDWSELDEAERGELLLLPFDVRQCREYMDGLPDARWSIVDRAIDKLLAQDTSVADGPSPERDPENGLQRVFLTERLTLDHQRPHTDG